MKNETHEEVDKKAEEILDHLIAEHGYTPREIRRGFWFWNDVMACVRDTFPGKRDCWSDDVVSEQVGYVVYERWTDIDAWYESKAERQAAVETAKRDTAKVEAAKRAAQAAEAENGASA